MRGKITETERLRRVALHKEKHRIANAEKPFTMVRKVVAPSGSVPQDIKDFEAKASGVTHFVVTAQCNMAQFNEHYEADGFELKGWGGLASQDVILWSGEENGKQTYMIMAHKPETNEDIYYVFQRTKTAPPKQRLQKVKAVKQTIETGIRLTPAVKQAVDFLRQQLAIRAKQWNRIEINALRSGISKSVLSIAKRYIGIESVKKNGITYWRLPKVKLTGELPPVQVERVEEITPVKEPEQSVTTIAESISQSMKNFGEAVKGIMNAPLEILPKDVHLLAGIPKREELPLPVALAVVEHTNGQLAFIPEQPKKPVIRRPNDEGKDKHYNLVHRLKFPINEIPLEIQMMEEMSIPEQPKSISYSCHTHPLKVACHEDGFVGNPNKVGMQVFENKCFRGFYESLPCYYVVQEKDEVRYYYIFHSERENLKPSHVRHPFRPKFYQGANHAGEPVYIGVLDADDKGEIFGVVGKVSYEDAMMNYLKRIVEQGRWVIDKAGNLISPSDFVAKYTKK